MLMEYLENEKNIKIRSKTQKKKPITKLFEKKKETLFKV